MPVSTILTIFICLPCGWHKVDLQVSAPLVPFANPYIIKHLPVVALHELCKWHRHVLRSEADQEQDTSHRHGQSQPVHERTSLPVQADNVNNLCGLSTTSS